MKILPRSPVAPGVTGETLERPDGRTPHRLFDRGALQVVLILLALFVGPAATWLASSPRWTAPTSPSLELLALLGAVLLSLVLPIVEIAMHLRRRGGAWVRGNREETIEQSDAAGRVGRAQANLIGSLVPFATIVLVAQASQSFSRYGAVAAVVYLFARAVHASSYVLGVTVIRSAAFYAGWLATIAVASQLRIWP